MTCCSAAVGDDELSWWHDGNDTLNGGAGEDDFMGGGGNDMIYADLMDDVIDGGEDEGGMDMDTVSFAKLVDMAVGTATDAFTLGARDATDDSIPTGVDAVGIEHVIGTDEDDFITGSDAAW